MRRIKVIWVSDIIACLYNAHYRADGLHTISYKNGIIHIISLNKHILQSSHRTRNLVYILGHEFLHCLQIPIIDRFIDILYEIEIKKNERKAKYSLKGIFTLAVVQNHNI